MSNRIIGYQVEDGMQCHPDGMFSFELYSKDVCQGYVDREPERYRLVTIREGDVEEPSFIINLSPITDDSERRSIFCVCANPDGSGSISSFMYDKKASLEYKSMVDVLEALILAQACAGIDILSPKYREALQTVVDKIFSML